MGHSLARQFLSTLSLRRATGPSIIRVCYYTYFYPRSPCGERRQKDINRGSNHIISIHALLAESDTSSTVTVILRKRFLSTLSLRRATLPLIVCVLCVSYFYPRSPCGERHTMTTTIYIALKFLSTLSLRRATNSRTYHIERDKNFYPRSPCGERQNDQ